MSTTGGVFPTSTNVMSPPHMSAWHMSEHMAGGSAAAAAVGDVLSSSLNDSFLTSHSMRSAALSNDVQQVQYETINCIYVLFHQLNLSRGIKK